ncbi:hypothetical protein SO802_004475 [Lithocarpus litseifolius]|uniref:Fungal lipase-type domain-containing protein n=1 Tax=Lithocarpus litseifolius TaxID=425828 RepID=A0AAW2E8R1_9ROSI
MSCDEKNFCKNYFVLKPNCASFYDLGCFLFSSESKDCKFIECSSSEDLKGGFWKRWYIFISLSAQKLLLKVENPMTQLGEVFEQWLNLLSSNGGLLRLFTNFLTGKRERTPDRLSAKFTSVVGNLDPRVELDKSIKYGNTKYNAFLSIMASKLSYENEEFAKTIVNDHWNMKFLYFDDDFENDYIVGTKIQTIMFQDTKVDPNLIVVAFRGTQPFNPKDWRVDVDLSWYEIEGVGKTHSGFMKALGLQMRKKGWPEPGEIEQGTNGSKQKKYAYYEIRQRLRDLLKKNKNAKFILTGHSLGGALAILFLTVLAIHKEKWLMDKLEGVYTFGQPRVGDYKLKEYMEDKLKRYKVKYFRFVYSNDIVPRVPYDDDNVFFTHFGTCYYYNSSYEGKVITEEPNKNYFSVPWTIVKFRLNAIWELNRSFIFPYTRGPEYKESWLMKMMRIFGLVFPGLVAHMPQDYVNATRLGSLPPDLQSTMHQLDSKVN